jgi:hypothetical protein
MSESPLEQAFEQQVAQIVAELLADKWEVVESPGAEVSWLPKSILAFQPDIVARRGDELLIGQAKSRNSRELNALNGLAEAVAAVPNARLEVYWLGDEPDTEPTRERVLTYVERARKILEIGEFDAAAITAWAALEGAAELYVAGTGVAIAAQAEQRVTTWQVISQLYSLGYVSERDYKLLDEAHKRRNQAAHFRSSGSPRVSEVLNLLTLVERMVNGQYVPVDLMLEWYTDVYDYPDVPLSNADRTQIRRVLPEQFPGTPDSDLDEAVERLEHDAAL